MSTGELSVKKIGVAGAGTMGRGIAQVFCLFNYPVFLLDKDNDILKRAKKKICTYTDPAMVSAISNNLNLTTQIGDLAPCDLIVEAVYEDEEVKKEILASICSVIKENAILATNTSSIPISTLCSAVTNRSRFIGMHFMNPPKAMKLVEVIKGQGTSDETVGIIVRMVKKLQKEPAVVNDAPGFVSNRLLFTLIGEAIRLLEKGVAKKEDIDTVMKYGMNHPMGPIELADFIGLDVCGSIMEFLYVSLGDEQYKPSPMLRDLISQGKVGKKSGEGFYRYG